MYNPLPNINLNGALDPNRGYFDAGMLTTALGLDGTNALGVAVHIGQVPTPDFQGNTNPPTWLWKPATVQSLMTDAAAATVRSAVSAYQTANPTFLKG